MKLQRFEEWFAVRPYRSDDPTVVPGRLTFDPENGISLETIGFRDRGEGSSESSKVGEIITGWLDYSSPTTLLDTWCQSTGGGQVGTNYPLMRDRRKFIANGILKNIFLENPKDRIFTGLSVEHLALHAWIAPRLVKEDLQQCESAGYYFPLIEVQPPVVRSFILPDGTQATVTCNTRNLRAEKATLEEFSSLKLVLPEPVNLQQISLLTWRVSALFEFLIGARVQAPVFFFPTTKSRMWNGEDRQVIAEYLYCPIKRKHRYDAVPDLFRRLTTEGQHHASMESILAHLTEPNDKFLYLANQIQTIEDFDIPVSQAYVEILGCLEAVDEMRNGSGADENYTKQRERLIKLVETHGSENDKAFVGRIAGLMPNKFSLLKRLERLYEEWTVDGFRGAPNLVKIRDLRNYAPHGRTNELSHEKMGDMITYLPFLAALGRYHVFKSLGFTGEQIGRAFARQMHRYGKFVPESCR